ncbi:MAG: hypothetical protein ACK2TV_16120, partial [Anaerolineales bacterium]
MVSKKRLILVLLVLLVFGVGCRVAGEGGAIILQPTDISQGVAATTDLSKTTVEPTPADVPATARPTLPPHSPISTQTASPTKTITLTPTQTEVVFEVGKEITIEYLRDLEITG